MCTCALAMTSLESCVVDASNQHEQNITININSLTRHNSSHGQLQASSVVLMQYMQYIALILLKQLVTLYVSDLRQSVSMLVPIRGQMLSRTHTRRSGAVPLSCSNVLINLLRPARPPFGAYRRSNEYTPRQRSSIGTRVAATAGQYSQPRRYRSHTACTAKWSDRGVRYH